MRGRRPDATQALRVVERSRTKQQGRLRSNPSGRGVRSHPRYTAGGSPLGASYFVAPPQRLGPLESLRRRSSSEAPIPRVAASIVFRQSLQSDVMTDGPTLLLLPGLGADARV